MSSRSMSGPVTLATVTTTTASDGSDACFICLSGPRAGALTLPCACPRPVHAKCLARWQLQRAGQPEELACRFCGQPYGDWRETLAPAAGALPAGGCAPDEAEADAAAAPLPTHPPAVIAITAHGVVHELPVTPGPAGRARFMAEVCEVLGRRGGRGGDVSGIGAARPAAIDADGLVFDCKVPATGERVRLRGLGAFDAAAHCAAATARAHADGAAADDSAATACSHGVVLLPPREAFLLPLPLPPAMLPPGGGGGWPTVLPASGGLASSSGYRADAAAALNSGVERGDGAAPCARLPPRPIGRRSWYIEFVEEAPHCRRGDAGDAAIGAFPLSSPAALVAPPPPLPPPLAPTHAAVLEWVCKHAALSAVDGCDAGDGACDGLWRGGELAPNSGVPLKGPRRALGALQRLLCLAA